MLRKELGVVESLNKINDRAMTLDSKNTGNDKPQIFIVDDEVVVIRALERLLGGSFAIATAFNAKDGLLALEKVKPDILLIDWALPDQSGLDILKAAAILHPSSVRVLLSG